MPQIMLTDSGVRSTKVIRLNDSAMNVFEKLPPDLQYLIGPAEKFGGYQFDDQIAEFLDRATETEMEELAAIAERFRLNGHSQEFDAFLDQFPITDHEESARLYFLFGLIDAAGIDFSDPNWNTVESHMESLQRFGSFRLASERVHAAKFLADFGNDARAAIPLLQNACFDQDERVRVWAHYALAKIQGGADIHIAAIRNILFSHDGLDEFDCYDIVGMEAKAALESLTGNAG